MFRKLQIYKILYYLCVNKIRNSSLSVEKNILWGDEIASAWQTCPLVSGVKINE